ncbi:unnamed protein product [Trichobilharzia regenti]|nr:unnamed protein product [Trichobilharzia regenti]
MISSCTILVGRVVSSDRRLRLGVFLYAIFLHLFIFIALYKAAHFQHSALETEANCHARKLQVRSSSSKLNTKDYVEL